MRRVKEKWTTKQRGIPHLPNSDGLLNNLRFADDILLIARPSNDITSMLSDIIIEAADAGLLLHPDKTKKCIMDTYQKEHNDRQPTSSFTT